jgi:hypothetical protein
MKVPDSSMIDRLKNGYILVSVYSDGLVPRRSGIGASTFQPLTLVGSKLVA